MRPYRRVLLAVLALAIAAAVVAAVALRRPSVLALLVWRQAIARFTHPIDAALFDGKALRVVLCGTSSPMPDPRRAESCAVVIAGDSAYVVDTGPESWKTLALMGLPAYFSEELMAANFELSLLPRPFTAAMMASEIPAAIRPYSMAVAPLSSARNLRSVSIPESYNWSLNRY